MKFNKWQNEFAPIRYIESMIKSHKSEYADEGRQAGRQAGRESAMFGVL